MRDWIDFWNENPEALTAIAIWVSVCLALYAETFA